MDSCDERKCHPLWLRQDKDTEWGAWWPWPTLCHGMHAFLLVTPLGSATQGCPVSWAHPFSCHLLSFAFVMFVYKECRWQEVAILGSLGVAKTLRSPSCVWSKEPGSVKASCHGLGERPEWWQSRGLNLDKVLPFLKRHKKRVEKCFEKAVEWCQLGQNSFAHHLRAVFHFN